MSVLIKGMKMPRYCAECDAVIDEELLCPFTNDDCENYFRVRNRNCPLSPVPAHGRCVDADVLWVEINKICDRRDAGIITDLTCLQQILSALRHAPTIIPAELPVLHGTFAATSEKEALKRIAMAEEGEA